MTSTEQYLSAAEKHKLSHHKDIYLIFRSIYILKICLAAERITNQIYESEINKLVERYHLLVDLIPDYDVKICSSQLCVPQKEILPALKEIQLRQNKKSPQNNSNFLFIQITSILIEALDFNDTNIGQARLLFERLINRLNVVGQLLKNEDFTDKIGKLKLILKQYISERGTGQVITQNQLDEIKLIIRGIYDLLVCLTRK